MYMYYLNNLNNKWKRAKFYTRDKCRHGQKNKRKYTKVCSVNRHPIYKMYSHNHMLNMHRIVTHYSYSMSSVAQHCPNRYTCHSLQ